MKSSYTSQDVLFQLFRGCLLGTAVGDSLGLQAEALSPGTIRRRWKGRWNQGFLFNYGMVSDDTEHTVMLCRALMKYPKDARAFQKEFASSLRWWLLGGPAGIGLATLKSIIRLWAGISPQRSGVYSAGNGPAMRIAAVGIFFADDPESLREYVLAATCLTHRDPKAVTGAMAIALTAAHRARFVLGRETASFPSIQELAGIDPGDTEWQRLMEAVQSSMEKNDSLQEFACSLGLSKGVSGYMYHTVPVCLYALFRHAGDFKTGLEALLNLGGDTDTTGAIYSALAGMSGNIPENWSGHIKDFPISIPFLEKHAFWLARASESGEPVIPGGFPWWGVPFRNAFFFLVVLAHCFRRIIPC
ncbi:MULTISPECIES: ADP-ribosylglycohydrolase family protein [unclassified Akkermansia]|uniref:ADP-ribosylglycohydrolase family protein n=1 Tax=unclassified Akkermansia TaxID=2608915 RepID=UPI00142F18D8|nr:MULTISPECIES: ADP-ribosylglycohydrolase family protein [unclassified Akkermansia]